MEPPPAAPAAAAARLVKKPMSTDATNILKAFAKQCLKPTPAQVKALLAEIHKTCPSPGDQQTTTKHVQSWFERQRRDPTKRTSKPTTKSKSPPNPNPAYPSLNAQVLQQLDSAWLSSCLVDVLDLASRAKIYEVWKTSPLYSDEGAAEVDIIKWIADHDPEYKAQNTSAKVTAPPLRVDTAAAFDFGMPTPTMSEAASTSPEPFVSASTSPTTRTTALPVSRPLPPPHRYPTPADSRASASMSPTTFTVPLPRRDEPPARFHPYRDYRPPTPPSRAASLALKFESVASPILPDIATLETELEVPPTPVLDEDEDEPMLESPIAPPNDLPSVSRPEPERAPEHISAEFGKNVLRRLKQRIEDGTLAELDGQKYGPIPTCRADFDARFSIMGDKLEDLLEIFRRGPISTFPG